MVEVGSRVRDAALDLNEERARVHADSNSGIHELLKSQAGHADGRMELDDRRKESEARGFFLTPIALSHGAS